MKTTRETLIKTYLKEFVTEDGKDRLCTSFTIPFNSSLLDLELTDEDSVWNVIYENEGVSIHINVDSAKQQFIRIINIPNFIVSALFLSFQSATDSAVSLLQKKKYEDNCYKRNKPLGYDNPIG